MSYLVLARKYRPTTFSEVVGQEHVTRTLANAFSSGRVHHAFLFCGPRGCGKTTLARIVGKALNCEQAQASSGRATAEPCGTCSACISIGNGSAVDYQEMDGASNRGIDAIRELTEAVRYQPAVLRKKVYVIDEVHMLTTEAFNALLKTLEEPPPHVTFVLATTEPHKLPNTILSRCQRYDFKLVPASRLAQHLAAIFAKESLVVDGSAISLLVRESGGSVRDALSLSDQLISYVGDGTITEQHVAEVLGVADRSLTRSLVTALATGDAGAALGAVESAVERGVDEVQLARAIVRYLRDLAVLQVAPERLELVDASDEERAELRAEATRLERSRVTQMFDRMLRCCDELGKTLQPRLVLDCALIEVATIEPLIPLGDLIERLSELEARIATPSAARAARPAAAPRAPAPPPPAQPRAVVMPAQRPAEAHASGPAGAGPSSKPQVETVVAPAASPPAARPPTGAATFAKGTVPGERSPAARPSEPAKGKPPTRRGGKQELATGTAPGTTAQADTTAAIAAATDARAAALRDAPPPAFDRDADASRGGKVDAVPHPAGDRASGPASMQPSGPVPAAPAVASGSGPHDDAVRLSLPQNADEALRAWNDVLGELERRRKFTLLGPFQHARVMKWTSDELELGFPVDVHSMGEMATERQNVDDLRAIVGELGMPKLRITVRMLDATESGQSNARSVLEASRERSSAERHKREAEAREHPITKHVLQTFGAQIKEIKTDV